MLDLLWQPFAEFAFLRRALAGGVALVLSIAPLGVFLMLRRMSLMGDAIAHGVLPGAALAFWLYGLSLPALAAGGLIAGLGMAALAAWVTRRTGLREDASLAAIYPIALASGVLLLGLAGRRIDLLHLLFGSALAVDAATLRSMLIVSAASLLLLALIYRPLVQDSLDALFLRSVSRRRALLEPASAGAARTGRRPRRAVCLARPAAVVLRQPAERAVHRAARRYRLPAVGMPRAGSRPAAPQPATHALLRIAPCADCLPCLPCACP